MPTSKNTRSANVGHLCHRTSRAITNDLNKRFSEAALGVTAEQWRVLTALWEHDGLTQNELSRAIAQEKTGVSRLVDGLERRGLVVRNSDPRDQRIKRINLSGKAEEQRPRLESLAQETLDKARSGISRDDLETCMSVLQKMQENMAE